MNSLETTDRESAATATHPRVTLADIEAAIAERYDVTGAQAADVRTVIGKDGKPAHHPLSVLSICMLVLKNGFTIIGKSAPASPENFNAELGRTFAYEDAVRQLWPLMGFVLRDRLGRA